MADLDNDIPAFWRVFFIYMDFLKWFLLCHGKDAVTIHSYGDLWGVQAFLLITELTSVSFFLGCPTLLIWPLIISPLSL